MLRRERDQARRLLYAKLHLALSTESILLSNLSPTTFNAIVSISKSSSLSVTQSYKRLLSSKIQRLLLTSRSSLSPASPCHSDSLHTAISSSSFTTPNIIRATTISSSHASRVTVLGDLQLPSDQLSLLNLGPSFCPSTPLNTQIISNIKTSFRKVAYSLRWKYSPPSSTPSVATAQEHLCSILPFPRSYVSLPPPSEDIDRKLADLSCSLNRLLSNPSAFCYKGNLDRSERTAFRSLKEAAYAGEIRISASDKGGEFLVLPQWLDRQMVMYHPSDQSIYEECTSRDFTRCLKKINDTWKEVAIKSKVDKQLTKRLTTTHASPPVLYTLVKTHKLAPDALDSMDPRKYKVRPIISTCGGPADKISWLLVRVLIPLLENSYTFNIKNVYEFLQKLTNLDDSPEGSSFASFDVEALYTNVDNQGAVEGVMDLLNEHHESINLYGLSIEDVKRLLEVVLDSNIFCWSARFYRQKRGLAMGNRIAPILAVAYMGRIEGIVLRNRSRPMVYCRYIDDIFIATNCAADIGVLFSELNAVTNNIRLTKELPKDGCLPFLNCEVTLVQGRFQTMWYREPACKNILINCRSAHPTFMKQNVLKQMKAAATKLTSTEEGKKNAMGLANKIAVENGYNGVEHNFRSITSAGSYKRGSISFMIPFVSDDLSKAISRLVRRSNLPINVLAIPPSSLKGMLVSSRIYDKACHEAACIICPHNSPGACMKPGCVYNITCECGDEYIGESGRPLRARIAEHLRAQKNPNAPSYVDLPMARHMVEKRHPGLPQLPKLIVTILSISNDPVRRRIEEAAQINLKKPKINIKAELTEVMRWL